MLIVRFFGRVAVRSSRSSSSCRCCDSLRYANTLRSHPASSSFHRRSAAAKSSTPIIILTGTVITSTFQLPLPLPPLPLSLLERIRYFLALALARGGVTGLPALRPPYEYLAFFSDGFKIWKEHMSVSSTLIIPPALSNSPQ